MSIACPMLVEEKHKENEVHDVREGTFRSSILFELLNLRAFPPLNLPLRKLLLPFSLDMLVL